MTPRSQPGDSDARDRLRAKIKASKAAAQASQTHVEAPAAADLKSILDRNEALPDALALRRLYRSKELVEKLPEEVEAEPTPAAATAAAAATRAAAKAAPMSPSEVRRVLREMSVTTEPITIVERPALGPDVLPLPPDESIEEGIGDAERGGERGYLLGALAALLVVLGFLYLAFFAPPAIRHLINPPVPTPVVTTTP